MKCELLVTTKNGQELAGMLTLSGDKVSPQPEKGYEAMLRSIIDEPVVVDEDMRKMSLKDDPQKWFENLPRQYSGSYLRAAHRKVHGKSVFEKERDQNLSRSQKGARSLRFWLSTLLSIDQSKRELADSSSPRPLAVAIYC